MAMNQFNHFDQVDHQKIQSCFFDDRRHRAYLRIPFLEKIENKTLCVIGQNPSAADEQFADRTVLYLEQYIHKNLPQYSQILMLNLYSRVDTKKVETSDLQHVECLKIRDGFLETETDFLIVFGQPKNERAYQFPDEARAVSVLLQNKQVFKLDIGTSYAPHPGNRVYQGDRSIRYSNLNIGLTPYAFENLMIA
jgi:hypothetical protein